MPDYYPSIGGASLYTQELASGLIQKGYEISVYTNGIKKEEFIHNDVLVKKFPSLNISRDYKISLSFIKEMLKERVDIIHSHHYGYFPATAGFIVSKLKKIPHVLSTHYHPPIYGVMRWALFSSYHLTQGLPILRFSEKVLTHSNFEKKMLCKIGASEHNINILPSIVDVKKFYPKRFKKPYSIKGKIILYVSALIQSKGYHIALDIADNIFKKRDDVTFIFIGHKGYDYIDTEKIIKTKVKKHKNKIIWMKDLKLSELIKWYNIADIFILPSTYEAFGKVIAEAQACEVPVISTKVGGIPEVIEDKKTGFLVNYGNWEEMQEKIEQLLDDEKLRKKMGKAARKRMIKKFSAEVVVNKLDGIYKSLV